jgi:hypothetical protein
MTYPSTAVESEMLPLRGRFKSVTLVDELPVINFGTQFVLDNVRIEQYWKRGSVGLRDQTVFRRT